MKKKLTITIDKSIIPLAKQEAEQQGSSLSGLIENYLKSLIHKKQLSFSKRWKGRFTLSTKKDVRTKYLNDKYK